MQGLRRGARSHREATAPEACAARQGYARSRPRDAATMLEASPPVPRRYRALRRLVTRAAPRMAVRTGCCYSGAANGRVGVLTGTLVFFESSNSSLCHLCCRIDVARRERANATILAANHQDYVVVLSAIQSGQRCYHSLKIDAVLIDVTHGYNLSAPSLPSARAARLSLSAPRSCSTARGATPRA